MTYTKEQLIRILLENSKEDKKEIVSIIAEILFKEGELSAMREINSKNWSK